MNDYSELRLIVKYRNRREPSVIGHVLNALDWLGGPGLPFILKDDNFGGVEWLKIVQYDGRVGYAPKRGKEHLFVRNSP